MSLADAAFGELTWREALTYVPTQVIGCVSGAALANVMFEAPAVSISTTERATVAHGVSEVVAMVGLLLVIFSLVRSGCGQQVPQRYGVPKLGPEV